MIYFLELSYLNEKEQKRVMNSRNSLVEKKYLQSAYYWKPVIYDGPTSIHYLVARLAPDFASLSFVFCEIRKRDPTFKPQSLFDFGSGIGTVLWLMA